MMPVQPVPSSSDWDDLRPIIKTLYLDKGWPLDEVMATVESIYGLKASSQMYKRRLTKWGIRKNCHLTDLRRLSRLERPESSTGRSRTESLHDSRPCHAKLLRYARRKGVAFRQDPQSPDVRLLAATQGTTPTPPTSIKDQGEVSRMEYLCWVLHGYIDSEAAAHSSNLAAWRQSAGNTKVLAIFQNIAPALQHFLAGQYQEGAKHLSRFYDGARYILEAYPVLLTRDILAMTLFSSSALPELLAQVLRHFQGLSLIMYGSTHPLSILLSWVSKNCTTITRSTAGVATGSVLIKILRNYCLRMVGPDHTDTADCEILLTFWQTEPVSSLRALLTRYDSHYGLGSYQSLHCLGHIQMALVSQHDWPNLDDVLTDLSRRPSHLSVAGCARLNHYIRACRATLAIQDGGHDSAAATNTKKKNAIESLCVGHYNTLAADEWKNPSTQTTS